jgi:glycosyltransferase involved in cell wall biosynthesis
MVSVIVPVYQVSEYVERCIRSVMAQSYQDLECIIVDDCTIDDSIKKCEELIRTYDGPVRFRMIHHDHNRGLSAARNTGTHEAKGDYLFYLDSDDYIAPDCIEKLVSAVLDDPTIEMVQGNCKMTDGSTESLLYRLDHSIKTLTNEDARKEFYNNRNIYISVWNRLLKRSFVEEHHLYCREGIVFEDLLWVFYLMKYLRKACLCEDITYYYCLRQGSILVEAKPESVRCYPIMFNEILQNLTIDHEREEINGYLYYFIKRYVSYVKVVSEFKETIRLYEAKAKQHGCWYVYMVLAAIGVISHFGNPMEILKKMNSVRWRIRGKSS